MGWFLFSLSQNFWKLSKSALATKLLQKAVELRKTRARTSSALESSSNGVWRERAEDESEQRDQNLASRDSSSKQWCFLHFRRVTMFRIVCSEYHHRYFSRVQCPASFLNGRTLQGKVAFHLVFFVTKSEEQHHTAQFQREKILCRPGYVTKVFH